MSATGMNQIGAAVDAIARQSGAPVSAWSVDLSIIAWVVVGVASAWAASYGLSRWAGVDRWFRVGSRAEALPSGNAGAGARLVLLAEQVGIAAAVLGMIVLLVGVAAVMVRSGETLTISIAGAVAVFATPLAVWFVESVELPRAERRAQAAMAAASEGAAGSTSNEPLRAAA